MLRLAPSAGSARHPFASRKRRLRLAIGALLGALALALLLAVSGLGPVADEIRAARWEWLVVAVGLELASCLSFVVVFRGFFDRLAPGPARALAWTSMASGAVLPAGGVGGLAISGSLMSVMGQPTGWIVRRSSAVFVLTSAMNVVTLIAAGAVLLAGGGGPGDPLRAGLPVLAGLAVIGLVVALARCAGGELAAGAREAGAALLRPTWRLAGAAGYLWFDVAALWAVLAAVAAAPPVAALVLGYLVGYLANALPIPGGIGVLDAGLAGALTLYGVAAVDATAAVLIYHAIVFWIPAGGGLVALAGARGRRARRRGWTRHPEE